MVSVQIDRTECLAKICEGDEKTSMFCAFLSAFAVRRKYSLLSSLFLAHSSPITALWLATSLARNFLSPSVIILKMIG